MNQKKIYLVIGIGLDQVETALQPFVEGDDLLSLDKPSFFSEENKETYSDEASLLVAVEASYHKTKALLPESFLNLDQRLISAIFAVPQFWLDDDGQINQTKSDLLKKILERLDLESLGFIAEGELWLTFFKKQEDDDFPNLVAIDVGQEKVSILPIVRGKILGSQVVERSNSITLDLEEGLARFDFDRSFPPRVLLLGQQDELSRVRSEILSYPWGRPERPFFLHLPKVEIFSYQRILAVLVSRANDFLFQIIPGYFKAETSKTLTEPPRQTPTEGEQGQALGFVKNKDIISLKGADADHQVLTPSSGLEKQREFFEEDKDSDSRVVILEKARRLLERARSLFLGRQGRRQEGEERGIPRIVVAIILLIFILLAGLVSAWWYLPRAELVLSVASKSLEDNVSLLVLTGADEVDFEKRIIPGYQVSSVLEESDSIETTGEGEAGDMATGEVTIFNRTQIERTFEKGTILIASGGLRFLTEEEVVLSPASVEIDENYNQTTTPSRKNVAVKAEKIGPDYNLSAGQEFELASFIKENFVARNENDLSGGSSRKVRVVTEEDREDLKEALLSKTKIRGEEELVEQFASGEKLIKESLVVEITQEEFSHEVNEETDSLSLALKASLSGLAYREEDLNNLIGELLKQQVPDGFVLSEERQASFDFVEKQRDGILFNLNFETNLYPDIDEAEVKRKIAGRRINTIKDYLSLLPNVNDFRVTLSPPMPDFLLTLPRRTENITIKIKTEN